MSAAAGQRARDAVYDIGVDVLKLTSVAGVLRGFLLLAALCGGILAIACSSVLAQTASAGKDRLDDDGSGGFAAGISNEWETGWGWAPWIGPAIRGCGEDGQAVDTRSFESEPDNGRAVR